MEGNRQFNSRQNQSRVSKALPPPPPPPPAAPNDAGIRGKSNPFPTQNRALPPIPRRPVGNQGDNATVRSVRSASSTNSESPKMVQSFGSIMNNGSMDTTEIETVPPPPPKHNNEPPQLPEIPKTSNHLHSLSTSSTGSNPSSPQSELWRRRSVKSDKNATISDLKLNKSNGSTAAPNSTNQPSPLKREHSLPPPPSESTRAIVGLPGRNIRKAVPVHEEAASPSAMGSQPSKISNAGIKIVSDIKDTGRNGGKSEASRISPVKRLPTPDYQPTDKPLQQQLSPQLFSPASPVTPSSVTSPGFRRDSLYLGEQSSRPDPPKPRDDRVLLPSLRPKERFEKPTATAEDIVPESPQPQKPSTASNVLAHQPVSSDDSVSSTLPVPASPNGVSSAAALSVVHLNCYQSHKFMRSSRNDVCPVECMVCETKDKERRWMCNWCSLRCCDPCMKGLVQIPGKDLRKFLESIDKAHRAGEGEVRVASSTYLYPPISPDDEAAILDLYSS